MVEALQATRRLIRNASTKVPTSGGTTTFDHTDIPSDGVVQYAFTLAGTNYQYDSIDRIRVYADGDLFMDLTREFLSQFVQRFGRSNLAPVATAKRFALPFYALDSKSQLERDVVQFPLGRKVKIDIIHETFTVATDTIRISAVQTNQDPVFMPRIVEEGMGIGASQTNRPFDIGPGPGAVRAYCINTTGLNKIIATIGGDQLIDTDGDGLIESELNEDTQVSVDPVWRKIHVPRQIVRGDRITLDTAAGWAGTGNAFATWRLEQQVASA